MLLKPDSPLPWCEFAESGEWWVETADAEGSPTGKVVMPAGPEAIDDGDLQFILLAVNHHEELVKLAQQVVYMCERRELPPSKVYEALIESASAVLAKLENK